jgi:hypothetical protein
LPARSFRPFHTMDQLVRRQFGVKQFARLFCAAHRQLGWIEKAHLREQ